MGKRYEAPHSLNLGKHSFCPGCTHPVALKLIARVLEQQNQTGNAIGVISVGCSLMSSSYLEIDSIQSAHGRAAATAIGAKRMSPDNLIFTYQGDGAASAIGLTETFHAANRGEPITVIMINNQIYGMTGGQSSPTTLIGQKTETTGPNGRNPEKEGYPVHLAEMIASLKAPGYVARFALNSPKNIMQAEEGIAEAFRTQMEDGKYAFVELLSACPTNWKMSPTDSVNHIETVVMEEFPIGVLKSGGNTI